MTAKTFSRYHGDFSYWCRPCKIAHHCRAGEAWLELEGREAQRPANAVQVQPSIGFRCVVDPPVKVAFSSMEVWFNGALPITTVAPEPSEIPVRSDLADDLLEVVQPGISRSAGVEAAFGP
jgi:hypothetical protein